MIIEPYGKYFILCKSPTQQLYRWYVDVKPGLNAWKVVNQNIEINNIFKGYKILDIEDISFVIPSTKILKRLDSFKDYITDEEFDFAVSTSDIEFGVKPFKTQSYRCHICDGVVANSFCTYCMFDWDS